MRKLENIMIKLGEGLEYLSIKFCENIFSIFEKNGLCQKPSGECKYCEQYGDKYLCKKKTYTPTLKLNYNFV